MANVIHDCKQKTVAQFQNSVSDGKNDRDWTMIGIKSACVVTVVAIALAIFGGLAALFGFAAGIGVALLLMISQRNTLDASEASKQQNNDQQVHQACQARYERIEKQLEGIRYYLGLEGADSTTNGHQLDETELQEHQARWERMDVRDKEKRRLLGLEESSLPIAGDDRYETELQEHQARWERMDKRDEEKRRLLEMIKAINI